MKKPLKSDKQKKLMCSTEVLFRRLLSVSRTRDIDLKIVLQHELAAVPPALFNDDGSMHNTNKYDLAKKLESVCHEIHSLSDVPDQPNTAYIIDGMAMLQALTESCFKTFNDVSEQVIKKILRLLEDTNLNIDNVTVVFDRYDQEDSIKLMERQRRGAGNTTPSHHVTGPRDVPNYRLFLKGSGNKSALAEFVSETICTRSPARLPQDKSITLAGGFSDGKTVKLVQNSGVTMLQHLFSTQEEADTRIVLHAIDLAEHHSRVIVRCDDTDVLVVLLYFYSKGTLSSEVYMHAGHIGKHVTRERYISVHAIAGRLGDKVCQCLPAAHALTGCDTTSALYKIGKRTVFAKLTEHVNSIYFLSEFGLSSSLETSLCSARSFVLLLYGQKSKKVATLDELRYILASTSDKTAAMLPPTEGAFKQHVLRAMFQTSIWCHSHEANQDTRNPVGHGWTQADDETLGYVMYERECAPIEVRDVTHLYCRDKDCSISRKCPCLLAGLPCIESCSCVDCVNSAVPVDQDEDNDDETDQD